MFRFFHLHRIVFFIGLTLRVGDTCIADDLEYVSDDELIAEISQREADIKRTSLRLSELGNLERAALTELSEARTSMVEIDKHAQVRVNAFYRMSRNAGTLKFLLNAESPTEAIRRMNSLKRLLIDGLDAKRQAGLRISEAERTLSRLQDERQAAGNMLTMLVETYESRVTAASKRGIRHKPLRLPLQLTSI